METFEKIFDAIVIDEQNRDYTQAGIQPLYQIASDARIVVIGQAPGRKAQDTQMVWNDASGDRLRDWLGVTREEFYNASLFAHLPMDFYYPGKGKSGDLPPRKGFADKWHTAMLNLLPNLQLMILVGSYAQKHYLKNNPQKNLTETVRHYQEYLPTYFPLVHPSPLNGRWLKNNPWFEEEIIPELQLRVRQFLLTSKE